MDHNILEVIDTTDLGKELQQARKRAALTQAHAAEKLGMARTTLVAIEQGVRRLGPAEIISLAELYGVPLHDLLRPRPQIRPFVTQLRGPFMRTAEDDEEITQVVAEFEDLCRSYLELEQLAESPSPARHPLEYVLNDQAVEAQAENIANAERSRLGLGDGALPALRDVLEHDAGMRIFFLAMPAKFSEIYTYTDDLGGCIAVNRLHPEERRRWSMAHGYFHFLAGRRQSAVEGASMRERQPRIERLADAFVGSFLMPTAGILRRFSEIQRKGSVTPADLGGLAYYYGASPQALTLRLEGLNLLPKGTWERVKSIKWREVDAQLSLVRPQADDSIAPLRYRLLAVRCLANSKISEGEFARFLRLDRLEARRLARALEPEVTGGDGRSSPAETSDVRYHEC